MGFVQQVQPVSEKCWQNFGIRLARLHECTADFFGLSYDNYIGLIPQSNRIHTSWSDFYVLERILPLIRLARDKDLLGKKDISHAERFCAETGSLFPEEPPALLHGDLWSGNFICGEKGVVLFDPAVYFGHREMDIAMTMLFGGFSPSFYESYHTHRPMAPGWRSRLPYGQLYYLLIHLIMFGRGYYSSVASILHRF